MKIFTLILFLTLFSSTFCQSTGSNKSVSESASNVEQVDTFVNVYFNKRATFINKYSKDISDNEQKELDEIVNNLKINSPKSSEYFYLEYVNRGKTIEAFSYLEKADLAYPNNVELFDDFMYHYELTNETNLRTNYSKKLYESNTVHDGLLEYNYNVLMSLAPNAVLITNGSDDTFPLFIWQDVFKIRKDVCIINIDMLNETAYIEHKKHDKKLKIIKQKNTIKTVEYLIENNPNVKIYAGHTVNQKLLEKYQSNLYLSGLTYQYSDVALNNVTEAVKRFENDFKTEQLKRPNSNKEVNNINFNYVLPLVTFLEYYKTNGESEKFRTTRDLILLISKRVQKEPFISEYLESLNL